MKTLKVLVYNAERFMQRLMEKRWFCNDLKSLNFTHIRPDKEGNWINQADNDFDNLFYQLVDKDVKKLEKQSKQYLNCFRRNHTSEMNGYMTYQNKVN